MTKSYPVSMPSITELEHELVLDAVKSGWISSLGPYINEFEEGFAKFCGTRHAIAVSNGTVAIHLALVALRIGPGDEVIVPDLSFIATANAVCHAGATPVFADIDAENLCLDPNDLTRCLTSRTKAVMPVHLYGHPANMAAINAFAEEHCLYVIEDAAEAHGASIDGKRVGSFGTCGTFSMYANKNLTTGEGGVVTTNDDELAERLRHLRDHAMSKQKRYWHDEIGYNYRMTNLQAALGCAQLRRAEELLAGRSRLLKLYSDALAGTRIRLNRRSEWATPSYWMICAEVDGLNEASREVLRTALRAGGVDTRPYFYPMSDMTYFATADTPVAHEVYMRGFNLPSYIDLTARGRRGDCQRSEGGRSLRRLTGRIASVALELLESMLRNVGSIVGVYLREAYYKRRLKACGKNLRIDCGVFLVEPGYISVGDNVCLDKHVIITAGLVRRGEAYKAHTEPELRGGAR